MQSSFPTSQALPSETYLTLPNFVLGAFFEACSHDKFERVKDLVRSHPEVLHSFEDRELNGFILAFLAGHLRILDLLLELGFDQNKLGPKGYSSFALCFVSMLTPNLQSDKNGFAVRFSQIEFLLTKGANTNFEFEGKNFFDILLDLYKKNLISIETLTRIVDENRITIELDTRLNFLSSCKNALEFSSFSLQEESENIFLPPKLANSLKNIISRSTSLISSQEKQINLSKLELEKKRSFQKSFSPIDFERIKTIVETDPAVLNDLNFSPFLKATLEGKPEVIKFLMDKGAFKKNQSHSLLKDCLDSLSANVSKYRPNLDSILACIDLYIRDVDINVYNKQGLSFINLLIFLSKKSPVVFDYLKKWSDLNWNLQAENGPHKNAFCYALEALSEESFEKYFKCFPKVLFPIPRLSVFRNDDLKEKAAGFLKEISNRVNKVSSCQTFKESYLLIKEAYSYFKEMQDLKNKAKTTTRHEPLLVERLLSARLLGVKEKKALKETEELSLVFENLDYFNIFKKTIEDFEVTIKELNESTLSILLSNEANKELPSLQINDLSKKYYTRASSYQSNKNKTSTSQNDSSFFGTYETQAPKIKVAKVHKPTAKELKTEQIARKLQNKNLGKQKASAKPRPKPQPLCRKESKKADPKKISQNGICKEKKPVQTAPTAPTSPSSNIQERIPIHEIPLEQLTPLPQKTNESHSPTPIRGKQKISVERVRFTPGQKNRLQIAINACDRIGIILEEIKYDKPFLLTKSLHSEIYIKSLSYQILRFCEALAPTSLEQNDDKDVDFFKEIYQFFLDKDEIRAIRRSCRTSFSLLDPSLLFDLAKALVDIGLFANLKEFSNKGKAPENFTKPSLHLTLKIQIPNFKMKLKEMPSIEKKAFLLDGIYNEIEFIESCIKASDNKETFSSYLDAIKKALSDLSKFASLLSKEKPPLKLLKLKSFKWLMSLGNKVAHHLKKGTEIGKPIDEVNIAKIWNFFDPKNNYALQLKEAVNKSKTLI